MQFIGAPMGTGYITQGGTATPYHLLVLDLFNNPIFDWSYAAGEMFSVPLDPDLLYYFSDKDKKNEVVRLADELSGVTINLPGSAGSNSAKFPYIIAAAAIAAFFIIKKSK